MSLVLFGNYPQSAMFSLSVTEVGSGSNELPLGPAVVYLDLQQFHVSPPPLMRFGGHLDMTCIHECTNFPDRASHMPGIHKFCRFLIRVLRSLVLSRALLVLAFRARELLAEVQVEVLLECPPVPLLSTSLHLDVEPRVVQIFQNPFPQFKFHFVPRASTVSRRLHCCPGGFLRTDLHLSKACFVPTRCSSDDASRPHQQALIHLFVSLAARTL